MRTGIEQARIEQAQWKERVAADEAALEVAEREAAAIRDRLNASKRTYVSLIYAIQQWDQWHADAKQRWCVAASNDEDD